MKPLQIIAAALLSGSLASPAAAGPITPYQLTGWVTNVNGSPCAVAACLPAGMDTTSFDFTSGLGTISFLFDPGPGTHHVVFGFDHAIRSDDPAAGSDDEYGFVHGKGSAREWEIDTGVKTLAAVTAGLLDDLVLDGTGSGPDDIALALGWHVTLAAGEKALFTIALTTMGLPVCSGPAGIAPACASLFTLHQYDPLSDQHLYLTGRLRVVGEAPEPVTLALLGLGFAACAWRLRRHWRAVASRTGGGRHL